MSGEPDALSVNAPEIRGNPREEVLWAAFGLVCGDRNRDYDEPSANFRRIADLWEAYARGVVESGRTFMLPHDVAVFNILQKVSRLTTSPKKLDTWVDIAGYAATGFEVTRGLAAEDD